MTYDFDEKVQRKGTDCMKYDRVGEACGRCDVLPMWVADMDFRTPPFVMEALGRRMQQGVMGLHAATSATTAASATGTSNNTAWRYAPRKYATSPAWCAEYSLPCNA